MTTTAREREFKWKSAQGRVGNREMYYDRDSGIEVALMLPGYKNNTYRLAVGVIPPFARFGSGTVYFMVDYNPEDGTLKERKRGDLRNIREFPNILDTLKVPEEHEPAKKEIMRLLKGDSR